MTTTNWKTGSGDWGTATNWTAGVPNSPAVVANLGGTTAYTVSLTSAESFAVGTLNITDASAALSLDGVLTVTTLLDMSAGSINFTGKIAGGAFRQTGGTITFANGALDKVKFEGTMNLSASSAIVRIYDGITLTGATGTGAGTVNVTGASAQMNFYGTQTVDNATIDIGNASISYLQILDTIPGAALTLGAGLKLVSVGNVYLTGASDATLVNKGTITAATGAATFNITPYAFTNAGTINVSNNESLTINVTSFSNTGTITVATGAVLHLAGSLVGTALGTITATTGTVAIDGTLDNAGNVLNVGTGSGLRTVTFDGAILNGTVHDAGNGFVFSSGIFDAVTYQGTMNLNATGAIARIYDGITLTGASGTGLGAVNITGQSAQMNFYGTQTVDNATIHIGSSTNTDYLTISNTGSTATLTLGAHLSLISGGTSVYLTGGARIVNQGAITAATGGGSFTISPTTFTNTGTIAISNNQSLTINATSFSNSGTITVASGGVLHLAGNLVGTALGTITATTGTVAIDGTLDNSGNVLNVGTGSGLRTVTFDGAIQNGTIHDGGNGFVFTSGIFDAVAYQGTMNLNATAAIARIYDGITLTGASGTGLGAVNITGQSAQMNFYGTQTVDNATIHIGSSTNTDYLTISNTGATATLTLGAHLSLISGGSSIYLTGGARIVNQGSITAATAGGSFTISPTTFTNAGKIAISNNQSLTISATSFSNSGTITVATGGVLHLAGNLVSTALGSITATTGTVAIDGTLDNSGFVLNVGTGSALRTVTLDGAILNGTVHDAGSGFVFSSGILDAVAYRGTMNLSATGAIVRIYDGITLTGLTGTGLGVVNITGQSAQMNFYGTQTLDNATIHIGSGTNTDYLTISNTGPLATLTLGAHLTLISGGTSVYLTGGARIVNQGTISAATAGGSFTISPALFTNAGTITVGNGDAVHIGALFVNTATAEAQNGTLDLQGNVGGTGGILKVDATGIVEVERAITGGQKVLFSGSGGTLRIDSADQFAAFVSGFSTGDVIDLANISLAGSSFSFTGTTTQGTVTVTDGTHTANVHLLGQYVAAGFSLTNDGHGDAQLSYTPPPAPAHELPQLAAVHH